MSQDWAAHQRAWLADGDADADGYEWTIEREVFGRLCAHWFSAGPNPEAVVQRVFAAASSRRPDLLRGMSRRDVELVAEDSARGRRFRFQQLFKGCGAEWRSRYRAIVDTLALAYSKAGRPVIARVTLRDALAVGTDRVEPVEAGETLSRILDLLFIDGPNVRAVAQITFALTSWLSRDLQLNMSLEQLGVLFSETRAAQSWRIGEVIGGLLRRARMGGCKAPWQKSEMANEVYAEVQRGNHNRASGARAQAKKRQFPTLKPTKNHAVHSIQPTVPGTGESLPGEMARVA